VREVGEKGGWPKDGKEKKGGGGGQGRVKEGGMEGGREGSRRTNYRTK